MNLRAAFLVTFALLAVAAFSDLVLGFLLYQEIHRPQPSEERLQLLQFDLDECEHTVDMYSQAYKRMSGEVDQIDQTVDKLQTSLKARGCVP